MTITATRPRPRREPEIINRTSLPVSEKILIRIACVITASKNIAAEYMIHISILDPEA